MKRGFETQANGRQQTLLLTVLTVVGFSLAVCSAWGEDDTISPAQPPPTLPRAQGADDDATFAVDQVLAQVRLLAVPTELVEATISDWVLAPFDQTQLAEAGPFAVLHQPLQRSQTKSGGQPLGQVTTGTEMRIPSMHKILNDHEAQQLLSQLEEDAGTQAVFCPKLAFIDGMTATAADGKQTPFVVGWQDGLPQVRVVSQGNVVRLRTVLDDDQIWLDYEILMSRILNVTTQSIRIVNRPQPVKLAVPHVQTTKAEATVKVPLGGTVLIGGLPAESQDGVPRQLLVLLRADRMRKLKMKKTAKSVPPSPQGNADADLTEPAPPELASPRKASADKTKNPFKLISRILKRGPRPTADLAPAWVADDPAPAPPTPSR